MDNPALRQEPRYEPASVIPLKNKYSLLDWLSAQNRLISRETQEEAVVDGDKDDMSELMDAEDSDYEEDDDDLDDDD